MVNRSNSKVTIIHTNDSGRYVNGWVEGKIPNNRGWAVLGGWVERETTVGSSYNYQYNSYLPSAKNMEFFRDKWKESEFQCRMSARN